MLHYIRSMIQTRVSSERGASAVEYGLLVALIALAITAGMMALSGALDGLFTDAGTELSGTGEEAADPAA